MIAAEAETFREVIDDALSRVAMPAGTPRRLADAIRYSLLAPGKRLRPTLVMMSAAACGGDPRDAGVVAAASAVEMIHAYSLIHDDLPSMDDDDLRRGRPTTHIEFDPATAILAGDALQPLAFATLIAGIDDPARAAACVGVLAAAAGPGELVGGQMDDLIAQWTSDRHGAPATGSRPIQPPPRTIETLRAIHARKTGALIEASCRLGGIVGGGSPDQISALAGYAADLGLVFQVTDDLLDATSSTDAMGKKIGKDVAMGKLTYVGLLGVDAARQSAVELEASARNHLSPLGPAGEPLGRLARSVLDRTR